MFSLQESYLLFYRYLSALLTDGGSTDVSVLLRPRAPKHQASPTICSVMCAGGLRSLLRGALHANRLH